MIISFDLRGRFQAIGYAGIGGGGLIAGFGFAPGIPFSASGAEYIYFCRHRLRR